MDHPFGPRCTAGPYRLTGADDSFAGPEAGVILGCEQPPHPKASLVADGFSGKNRFGYFTQGISMALPASGLLNSRYSLGNDSYGSNSTRNRLFLSTTARCFSKTKGVSVASAGNAEAVANWADGGQ